ncbi:exonuclease 3-5 domain containing 2-like [Planoprotostelium fungivorum]|uniref:Exonuclease 3-5 domain containing 2-like n=1 Tax=Planoprotostelium fungivorum TaxID=1890364 RepID=A0A2P6NMA0_9EUKA|nr:exonuclease 3-5 domain containing 2-like [Planoprotostelium fungivorum]
MNRMEAIGRQSTTMVVVLALCSVAGYIYYKKRQADLYRRVIPPNIPIHLIQNETDAHRVTNAMLERLLRSEFPVVGLDAEWKPHGETKSPIAMIQLSDGIDCILLHVHHFGRKNIPPALIEILSSARIVKVGVGIDNDMKMISSQYETSTSCVTDLRSICLDRHLEGGRSLAAITQSVLHLQLDKRHEIQCSNWEEKELSRDQIHYAAADAWSAQAIFKELYEGEGGAGGVENVLQFASEVRSNGGVHHKRAKKTEENLAGKPIKRRRCVVCGYTGYISKIPVVPRKYREFFPLRYKERSCHDILRLCHSCYQTYLQFCEVRREELATQLNAPLQGNGKQVIVDRRLKLAQSLAKQLLSNSSRARMSEERVREAKEHVAHYLKKRLEDVNEMEDVEEVLKMEATRPNEEYLPHEALVMQKYEDPTDLNQFVKEWRYLFLRTMQPRFMPHHWDPERPLEECTFVPWREGNVPKSASLKRWMNEKGILLEDTANEMK